METRTLKTRGACRRFFSLSLLLTPRRRNWSFKKRAFVAFCISFLTFSIYIGSAIYTSSIPGLMAEYDVSLVHATLGLTLYVLGYGLGPMFLSPLSELPQFGRTSVYIVSLFLFVVLQVPTALAKNLATVLKDVPINKHPA